MTPSSRLVALMVAVTVLASCSEGGEPLTMPEATLPTVEPPEVVYPGDDWERDERGDWGALDRELAARGSTCVTVVQGGRLVHDRVFNGAAADAPVPVYSITKSLTALLVGMAADEGYLTLDDSASEQVDEWRIGPAEDVTVRDLLSMTSGREWSEATDRTLIRQVSDQTAFAIGLSQADEPGEWVYDNAAPQVLERVLAESAAEDGDVVALARRRLLRPLRMRDTQWPTDRAGHATTYSGGRSTCQDLARVGHLVLNEGRWDGEQLVSADFVEQMTSPSSDRNAAYGLLWWTNAEGRVVEVLRQAGFSADKAPYRGRLAPSVPADATWAFGYGNQYVAVVPSLDLVAVRLGRRPASPDQVTFASFTAGVIDAIS